MTDIATHTPDMALSTAMSNLLVKISRQTTGRGPTRARTHFEDDLVTVVLRGTLTAGEQTLVDDGRGETVLMLRRAFDEVQRAESIAGVESLLQRDVLAYLTATHLTPDVTIKSFVLAPRR